MREIDGTLSRLGTDYLDLYIIHRFDFDTPIIGATKASYLDDAAGVLNVKLTAEDIAYLEEMYVPHPIVGAIDHNPRSEERRIGKECRSRWSPYH